MSTYEVTIRAAITKTYVVEADNKEAATQEAHEMFDICYEDNVLERYIQETIDCTEQE